MKTHKEYIQRDDLKGATHLEVRVSYDKGGANSFYGGTKPRGYYLTITPVKKTATSVSFAMFSGVSRVLLETKRFSAKQFAQAREMAKGHQDELIAAVVEKNKAA